MKKKVEISLLKQIILVEKELTTTPLCFVLQCALLPLRKFRGPKSPEQQLGQVVDADSDPTTWWN